MAGLDIFAHPLLGLTTIMLVCIAALFVSGIAKAFWAFKVPSGSGRWLLLPSGLLSILVAGMLYTSFPFSAVWAFGVLIGVNLIVDGGTLLAFVSRTD